jgi:hypothetical protein
MTRPQDDKVIGWVYAGAPASIYLIDASAFFCSEETAYETISKRCPCYAGSNE